jgi:plastocyanin
VAHLAIHRCFRSREGTPVETSFVAELQDGAVVLWNNRFYPHVVSVGVGETLTWRNLDDTTHNVVAATFNDRSRSWSKFTTLEPEQSTAHTFPEQGVYEYQCTIHGESTMCGVVRVGRTAPFGNEFESPCADQYEDEEDQRRPGGGPPPGY